MTGATSLAENRHLPSPASLPLRLDCALAAASGRAGVREPAAVFLDGRTVVMKRRLSGLPLTLSVAVGAYEGVAVRIEESDETRLTASVVLRHADPALSVPLVEGADVEAASDAWESWARTLRLPMLLEEADGSLRRIEPDGRAEIGAPAPRRRRGNSMRPRPRFLMRRRTGHGGPMPVIDGVEIIARD